MANYLQELLNQGGGMPSGSAYSYGSPSYNPNALGNSQFLIPAPQQGAQGGTVPAPPSTIWGAPNPGYQTWTAGQTQNTPSSLSQQDFQQNAQADAAQWSRVMEFLKSIGILGPSGGMGLGQGLQQFAGQSASLKAEPAIRSYERAKSDVANRLGSRGMSLSSAGDRAYGEAYGDLSRALAEAGTFGDVSAQGMQYSLLGDILRSAVGRR